MATNNRISTHVSRQLPFFVRNDHPTFIAFMESYFEYLEQSEATLNQGKVVERQKNLLNYINVDTTLDDLADKLYKIYLKYVPTNILADKTIIIKHVKDFYRAKGTEKSLRFLLRIIANEEIDVYYPKRDILRASAGKWFIQKSLRVTDVRLNSVSTTSFTDLELFINKNIVGSNTSSTAVVERCDRFYESGTLINELIITSVDGSFENGEQLRANISANSAITANIFGGIVSSIQITAAGTGYEVGDDIVFESNVGSGAAAIVSSVTSGNLQAVQVSSYGAGFRANDNILITGGGGSGANIYIATVDTSQNVHPNAYTLYISLISSEANTNVSNAIYSNLLSANANTTLANSLQSFIFANTGPIATIAIRNAGEGYSSVPSLDAVANTRIKEAGILGRMTITNGGLNYTAGDRIEFISSQGYGANGNVTSVAANGKITRVDFSANTGWPIGGMGYKQSNLPTTNVRTSTGNGANITVNCILGDGEAFSLETGDLGAIQAITITARGQNYTVAPTINLSLSGDGTAQAVATVISGVFSYPGRYLNDDGHVSSYNFLQDRDYYQNFSYVIKVRESYENYEKAVRDTVHPAGMKFFGEYLVSDSINVFTTSSNSISNTAATIAAEDEIEA